jgi:hypothetical protein
MLHNYTIVVLEDANITIEYLNMPLIACSLYPLDGTKCVLLFCVGLFETRASQIAVPPDIYRG